MRNQRCAKLVLQLIFPFLEKRRRTVYQLLSQDKSQALWTRRSANNPEMRTTILVFMKLDSIALNKAFGLFA